MPTDEKVRTSAEAKIYRQVSDFRQRGITPKVIVLATGGLDSTLCIARLAKWGFIVIPLFFDYGQYPKRLEEESVQAVCWNLNVQRGFQNIWEVEKASIDLNPTLEPGIALLDGGREIMLVGAALSWAFIHSNDYNFIALGTHAGNEGPGCKPGAFDELMNQAIKEATEGRTELLLPIQDLVEEEVGKELHSYMDLKLTYNCYWDPPCGFKSKKETYRCPGCRRKALSMRASGGYSAKEMEWPNLTRKTYEPLDGVAEDRK
jgi:7-cyano-7-deazaguanine synthase